MLTELKTFANRPENIREVFLISFRNHRPNIKTNRNGNCNAAISSAVLQTLCENVTDCPAAHQSSEQWLSLAEMLRRGQRYVIASVGNSDNTYIIPSEVRKDQPLSEADILEGFLVLS